MDYPCAKFGNFGLTRFVSSYGHTHTQRRMITNISISNNNNMMMMMMKLVSNTIVVYIFYIFVLI